MNNALISTLLSLAIASSSTPSDGYAGRKDCPKPRSEVINIYEAWSIEKSGGRRTRYFVIKKADGSSVHVRIETKK